MLNRRHLHIFNYIIYALFVMYEPITRIFAQHTTRGAPGIVFSTILRDLI